MSLAHTACQVGVVRADRCAACASHGASVRSCWIGGPCDGVVHIVSTTVENFYLPGSSVRNRQIPVRRAGRTAEGVGCREDVHGRSAAVRIFEDLSQTLVGDPDVA